MAGPFTVYSPGRPGGYLHTAGPERIEEFRFAAKPWKGKRVPREWPAKPINAKKWIRPKSVGDVLHNEYPDECVHCGGVEADDCGEQCIEQYRNANFKYEAEIRPAKFDLGAFNGKEKLPKDKYIGEYLGCLIPINEAPDSMYRMTVEGIFCVDANSAGNWTRYINSSCTPNLHCRRVCIGKRFGLFFHTLREILPGEELTFAYGYDYFAGKGMKCGCDWKPELHDAKGAPDAKKRKKQNQVNTGEITDESTEEEASPPSKPSKSSKGSKGKKDKVTSGRVTKSSKKPSSRRASSKNYSSMESASKNNKDKVTSGRVTKSSKNLSSRRASSKNYSSMGSTSKGNKDKVTSGRVTRSTPEASSKRAASKDHSMFIN
ncbi:hypothetical protein AC578_2029 [Pseudocercospora eumusae]|uniref:SET domain-containing protein n=1 Tax=Pseudocercospora eumusae TaxID=321146 RepID=A0A139HH41_9PEZI|nr:hypothetical protein AC578_2029 [Pseudocercospora eumusae]